MDLFEKISVSLLIWYLVPGLGLILFFVCPLLVLNPAVAKLFVSTVGPFGIVILGIILGFLLDGLRLYRFRPRYFTIRGKFFGDLQATIAPNLNPYFIQSCISDVAKSKNVTGLSLHHAIWIMLGDFTILSFIEAFFWTLFVLYLWLFAPCTYHLFDSDMPKNTAIIICSLSSLIFWLVGFRFLSVSKEDQNNTNRMFIDFANQHRDEIRRLLNVLLP
jgi:hypothetical protein